MPSRTFPTLEQSRGPVRVFILDDQELVRHGLRILLEKEGLDVVGVCGSAREAGSRIADRGTQVAVLHARLPDGTGIEVCRDARSANPDLKCLILTSHDDDEALHSVVLAGAAGYVLRQLHSHRLAGTILRAAAGEPLLAPGKLARVKTSLTRASESATLDDLTDAEKAVLTLITRDRTNRQISEALGLHEATVRGIVSTLLSKLGFGIRMTTEDEAPATSAPGQQTASPGTSTPGSTA